MRLSRSTTVCVFAKAFAPGLVKTRLIPALGADGAAQLATAMFQDVQAVINDLPWAHVVIASTAEYVPESLGSAAIWPQGDGHLGARLERVLRRALGSAQCAIAVGGDSPGLERRHFEQARTLLDTYDAVLGPADDGGFYMVGLKRCPEGLFDAIRWSEAFTLGDTRMRFQAMGLKTAFLSPWFDVDEPEDVRRISRLIESGQVWSPRTAAALRRLWLVEQRNTGRPESDDLRGLGPGRR